MCKFSRAAGPAMRGRTLQVYVSGLPGCRAGCYRASMRMLLFLVLAAGLPAGVVGESPADPAVGRFLIAAPHLADGNFRQTVILLVAADESGALGLIVNRPVKSDSNDGAAYYFGGPVPAGRPFVLFRSDDPVREAGRVVDDVYVTVSESVLDHLSADGLDDTRVRIYIGYSGWGAGQLEAEIGRGDWTVREATGADVFDAAPRDLWRRLSPPAAPLSASLMAVRPGIPGPAPVVRSTAAWCQGCPARASGR